MKTAIISGANGNLGSAVVRRFLQENYRVFGLVRRAADPPKITGPAYKEKVLELTQEAACAAFIQEIPKVDIAVLTAGSFAAGGIASTVATDIRKQYQLNFETAYNLAKPIFLKMQQQGSGRLFFIGARQGIDAASGKEAVAYTLSKSLLFRLAEIFNAEARETEVVCAVVVPGIIDTPQNRQTMPKAAYADWADPNDIAGVIAFYASGEATIIREPVIRVYHKS